VADSRLAHGGGDGSECTVEVVDPDEDAGAGTDGGTAAVEQGPEFAVDVAVVVGRRRKAARSPAAIREIS
jgi:hypothetical protein